MLDIDLTWPDIIGRMLLASGCGAIVGWNREALAKPAGLRTNMLVALGACTFTLLGLAVFAEAKRLGGVSDPIRLVEAVAGGIGFLGAATVFRGHGTVEGVTTAAAVWVVGAVGLACGLGSLKIAVLTTLMAFLTLAALGALVRQEPPAVSDEKKPGESPSSK